MRKLILLGIVIILLLLVIGAVWISTPAELLGWRRYAIIFLGILTGLAAIAEIVGLINYLSVSDPKRSIEIKTKGSFSPGEVKKNYRINPALSPKKDRHSLMQSSNQISNQVDELKAKNIQTEGDYSPGIVEGDYEVNDGK